MASCHGRQLSRNFNSRQRCLKMPHCLWCSPQGTLPASDCRSKLKHGKIGIHDELALSAQFDFADSDRASTLEKQNIFFWMSVHDEYVEAAECLEDLRRHFPYAPVAVRADGDEDPRYAGFSERFKVEIHYGPRLFTVEHGGALIVTMLKMFLKSGCQYLFKIDPDTHVHRAFYTLPTKDCVFGTLQGEPTCLSVQGGCLGMTKPAATLLFDSGLLNSPQLRYPHTKADESQYWKILSRRAERVGLTSFDWSIGWAAKQLNLPLLEYREVCSNWQTPMCNRDLQYAITHPRSKSVL